MFPDIKGDKQIMILVVPYKKNNAESLCSASRRSDKFYLFIYFFFFLRSWLS